MDRITMFVYNNLWVENPHTTHKLTYILIVISHDVVESVYI